MGLFASIGKVFNRGKTNPLDPSRSPDFWGFPTGYLPVDLRLSPDEMISCGVVYACIRQIVDPIVNSPVMVVTRANGKRKEWVDDPASYLLNVRPNPEMTAAAFKEALLTQMLIWGNGYAEIVFDGAGRVAELWPLQSENVRPTRHPDDGRPIYIYVQPQGGNEVYLEAEQVLHIKGPSLHGYLGDSLVFRASKSVALAVAQERFATTYFGNGTIIGGFIRHPQKMDEVTRNRLRDDLKARYGGVRNAHGLMVLEGGAEYQAIQADGDKTQLNASRALSVEEIARIFSVPPYRLGVTASAQGYGKNLQETNRLFINDSLAPHFARFGQELQYKLFPQRAPWREIEFDTAWLLKGNDKDQAEANEIRIRSGQMTVNEARESWGQDGIGKAGELTVIGNNLVVLTEENLTKTQPAPAPTAANDNTEAAGEGQDPAQPEKSPVEPAKAPKADSRKPAARLVAAALDRHERRVKARTADLQANGKAPEEIATNIKGLAPKAAEEIAAILEIANLQVEGKAVNTAIESVAAGVEPVKAAEYLVG